MHPVMTLDGICKSYGDRQVNKSISITLQPGRVHALLGENGAGKSTLLSILTGETKADRGSIRRSSLPNRVSSTETEIEFPHAHWNPVQAERWGIGLVHQHFLLNPDATVLDNLALSLPEKQASRFFSPWFSAFHLRRRQHEKARIEETMNQTGLQVSLDRPVASLSLGEQSRCELLKVLLKQPDFILLDEPTAVLTPEEVHALLSTIRKLKEMDRAILLVTHKLKEVLAVADDISVLRDGTLVFSGTKEELNPSSPEDHLARLMVGRSIQWPHLQEHSSRETSSRIGTGLDLPSWKLQVNPGEIVGIAGLDGQGQHELMESYFTAYCSSRAQSALVPLDRQEEGLVGSLSLRANLALGRESEGHKDYHFIDPCSEATASFLRDHNVSPPLPLTAMSGLSGGNQQKLIFSRECFWKRTLPLKQAFIGNPTRGVDIGALARIHESILELAREGTSILLVSTELEELLALSHRIGVLKDGRVQAWFQRPFDITAIGRAMGGASP